MKSWIVYEHTSPSGKVYVGITCQKPQKRWKGGAGYVRTDNHQRLFANAIKKYGWNNIKHTIVAEKLTRERANFLEQCLIGLYKKVGLSYNITDGGDGGLGTKHTEETKKKLSLSHTGRKEDREDTIRRINIRIDNYPYYIVAVNSESIHIFRTTKEAAEALGIKCRCNISAAIAGKQCLVNGYIFIHWDKTKPLDEEFLHNLYEERVNNRYITERKKVV